ncbi:MAG TPA: ATP synthase F1 subunit delta [Candidatus Eremiobacteraceae bacterium]|nr:ATP synthase F1 subunit delta [Candidatus Eremiobacteraceae bacterium]
MADEVVARRYADAYFALAQEDGDAAAAVRELDVAAAAIASDPAVDEFFTSPVIDRSVKESILTAALASASELARNFIILLSRKRREKLLPAVVRRLHESLDREAGRAQAHIATPSALGADRLAGITTRLGAVYDEQIVPHATVEPDLLGGIVIQVGDRYVDGSVAGKLEEVRRHLLESAGAWGEPSPNGQAHE